MFTSTPEQQAEAKAKRQAFRELAKTVAAMSPADKAKFPVVATIEGHTLSVHNQILAIMQQGDVTLVGGFKQWRNVGRKVKKGGKGIMIWFPTKRKSENSESDEPSDDDIRFCTGYVFDISQTEELQS